MKPDYSTIVEAISKSGGFRPAERLLRSQGFEISERSIRRTIAGRADPDEDFTVEGEPLFDVEALLAERRERFEQLREKRDFDRLIPVRVNLDGPIGIGFMGDPHVDSDGCNIEELIAHTEVFDGRNKGLFGACLGDIWNNWTGRLSRLWSEQTTDSEQAKALVRWYINKVYWLFVVFGNHDCWSGHSNILEAMLEKQTAIQRNWRAKVGLKFPNGRVCKIYAAHRFPGSSQIVEQLGAIKKAKSDGQHDIYVAGDKHVAGYSFGMHPGTQKIFHAVQVGSYKEIDTYADELTAENLNVYKTAVALIDPYAKDELNYIRWEFDPLEAAERLKWMRNRWEMGKST